ncbi:MAG: hypothetical protein A2Z32_13145 [Chloroflexi bacterium RBG_16_69_14]|nr:MAG: hypothetical protein A2Z32_13145 [Chloroflexi bacterium RBG_16_69_14]
MSALGLLLARVAARSGAGIRYVLGKRHPFGIAELDYDDYWRARGDHQVVARFPIIAKHLNRGETLLDIGCGEGTGIAYLMERTGVVGVGLDISSVAVEMARSKGVDARVADIMAPDFAPDRTYDTVLISEVLEHIAEPERVVTGVRDHVGQRIILTFPNIAFLPHRLRLLFGSFPVQWGWHPGEHLRFWSLSDFAWWLDQLGYDVVSVQASNGIRGLAAVRPSLFGNQIVVVARPRR